MTTIFNTPFPEMVRALKADKHDPNSPYEVQASPADEFVEWFIQDHQRVVRMVVWDDGTTWYEVEDNSLDGALASLWVSKSGSIFRYRFLSTTKSYMRQVRSQTPECDAELEACIRQLFGFSENDKL